MALVRRAGVAVALVERDVAGLGAELGNVEGRFVFGTDHDRQIDFPIAELQLSHLAHRGIPFVQPIGFDAISIRPAPCGNLRRGFRS